MLENVLKTLIKMFKEQRKYDIIDEKSFDDKKFLAMLLNYIEDMEIDTSEEDTINLVEYTLTVHQYMKKDFDFIKEDLKKRNLENRIIYIKK